MSSNAPSTAICHYDETDIFVRGRNLCTELIGKVQLTDFLYLLVMGSLPTEAQRAVVEAAIVAMAEHGMTQSAIAARLTYLGAPESLQGAVAAGILGVGDQFVGTVELVAPLLEEIVTASDIEAAAQAIVARYRQKRALLPGFGHPHHKPDDPRSPALFAVGKSVGVAGRYVAALELLSAKLDAAAGRHFTINAPGAISALFLEVGIPARIMRGFIIISRCIGLVGHLREEQVNPIGRMLWDTAAQGVNFADDRATKIIPRTKT
jgi:citrate synthase